MVNSETSSTKSCCVVVASGATLEDRRHSDRVGGAEAWAGRAHDIDTALERLDDESG
jgi:hypothetical protein